MDIAISLTPNLMLDEREIIPFFSLRILSKRACNNEDALNGGGVVVGVAEIPLLPERQRERKKETERESRVDRWGTAPRGLEG